MAAPTPKIEQWIIDTRPLWPVNSKLPPRDQIKQLEIVAAVPLELLSASERPSVLRFFFAKDAKMSLASALVKRYAITTLCNVPWAEAAVGRNPENYKPCYTPPPGSGTTELEFNVSHQAGLVTAVAAAGRCVELGTDVVCVNERDDYGKMERHWDGFFGFVDIHGDVFAEEEIRYLKLCADNLDLKELEGMGALGRKAISQCQDRNRVLEWKEDGEERKMESNVVIDAKLRRFYALWCLREAYVKMTGEALLAPWLRELEFRNFRAPRAISEAGSDGDVMAMGERLTAEDFEIWFKGKRVLDVRMELLALGENYMVATAARQVDGRSMEAEFEKWKWIEVERDIYPIATGISASSPTS